MLHPKPELANCAECGKMFRLEDKDDKYCPECDLKHERLLRKVKDLILAHPGLTAAEVSEKADVPYGLILEWINEGRLER